jgi:hypothetical protein
LILIIYFGIKNVYEVLSPFNKNKGIEFNIEREKIGLPKLDKTWILEEPFDEQFTTTYWKQLNPRKGHFKKIIEYGIFGAQYETDYYKNLKLTGTFAWSRYDFEKSKFEYFLEKPNKDDVLFNAKGNRRYPKPTVVVKINKEAFDKYKLE